MSDKNIIKANFNAAQQVADFLEKEKPDNFIFITKLDDGSIYTYIGTKTYYDAAALAFTLPSTIEREAENGHWTKE